MAPGGRFPLTLTLSLGEREHQTKVAVCSKPLGETQRSGFHWDCAESSLSPRERVGVGKECSLPIPPICPCSPSAVISAIAAPQPFFLLLPQRHRKFGIAAHGQRSRRFPSQFLLERSTAGTATDSVSRRNTTVHCPGDARSAGSCSRPVRDCRSTEGWAPRRSPAPVARRILCPINYIAFHRPPDRRCAE